MHLLLNKMSSIGGVIHTFRGNNGLYYYKVDSLLDECRQGNPMETGNRKSVKTFLRKHDLLLQGIARAAKTKPEMLIRHIEDGLYEGYWVAHEALFPFLTWLDQRFLYEATKFFMYTTEPPVQKNPYYSISQTAQHLGKTAKELMDFLIEQKLVHWHRKKGHWIGSYEMRKGKLITTTEKENEQQLFFSYSCLGYLKALWQIHEKSLINA